jgi:hypothetical protein
MHAAAGQEQQLFVAKSTVFCATALDVSWYCLAENPSPFVSADPNDPKFIVSLFDDGENGHCQK